ncbi:MAG: hypothetical protein SFU27_11405 [Thermonemataceae bacterium]|nr:hypothetical protein [Thermonemataceae bacterium]
MQHIWDLLKIILPAGLVLLGMYLTVRTFLQKEFERRLAEIKLKNTESITAIRLQAYERMCLYLERIMPDNLLIRLQPTNFSSEELQHILLHEIRNEFSHNFSQQMYMSHEAWERIKNAREEIITLINNTMMQVSPQSNGLELAKKILENIIEYKLNPSVPAIAFLKEELKQLF